MLFSKETFVHFGIADPFTASATVHFLIVEIMSPSLALCGLEDESHNGCV